MKHADNLTPTETLYESRLFEALERADPEKRYIRKLRRQVRVRCKDGCDNKWRGGRSHRPGKLWIVDFYIWPHLVVEIDGHDIDHDRDACLHKRGLFVYHVQNSLLYQMESALAQANDVVAVQHEIDELKQIVNRCPADPATRDWLVDVASRMKAADSLCPVSPWVPFFRKF